ncbi:hypothetical protein AB9K34_04490 [Sedimentitalea sp. XS_ASV28]|uniref:hypothetical protein n=1 Tax=Sedimentitalea sp. XS_ASV28 TaxID=3241296 RepID=UPI003510F2D5
MFEPGKEYNFVTLESAEDGPEQSESLWTVVAVEGNLLHLQVEATTGGEFEMFAKPSEERNMVLNTASQFFHSATPVTE